MAQSCRHFKVQEKLILIFGLTSPGQDGRGWHLEGWHWWRRQQSNVHFPLWTAILLLLQAWKWLHLYHWLDVLCRHPSFPTPPFLYISSSSLSAASSWIYLLLYVSLLHPPPLHHRITLIPLALSRRPACLPLVLSTPWLFCAFITLIIAQTEVRCLEVQYSIKAAC